MVRENCEAKIAIQLWYMKNDSRAVSSRLCETELCSCCQIYWTHGIDAGPSGFSNAIFRIKYDHKWNSTDLLNFRAWMKKVICIFVEQT